MTLKLHRPALSLMAAMLALMSACGSNLAEVAVDDSKNGQSVQVHVGDVVKVTLTRTGWTFHPSSDVSLLKQLSDPVETRDPNGYPGMDSGVTTDWYKALSAGSAVVTATRVNCGEARRCPGTEGVYQVTILITS